MGAEIPECTLNDGTMLPAVGFGTYRLNGPAGVRAMVNAIEVGYRLFDTAYNYENEGAVGEVVRRSPVPREELVITSKLPGRYHAYDTAVTAVHESLYRAGLQYYDLYLIHWPNPSQDEYPQAWQALVDLRREGLIRSIGVSNFMPEHLERIRTDSGVTPSVNQIELHPFFPQADQRAYDESLGIRTEAWSPIGRANALLTHPVLQRIAASRERTVAQVILRWHYQRGTVPIPKASSPERQRENLALFDFALTEAEVEEITALGRPDGRNKNQDPQFHEEP